MSYDKGSYNVPWFYYLLFNLVKKIAQSLTDHGFIL